MNTKNLETLYAGFDLHYDKSDDHSVWSQWMRSKLLNLNIFESKTDSLACRVIGH
jgi:hypothetical protein